MIKQFSDIPDSVVGNASTVRVERAVQFFVEALTPRVLKGRRVHVEFEVQQVVRKRAPDIEADVLHHPRIQQLVVVSRALS